MSKVWPFGNVLKELREAKGLSINRLATRCGLTPGYVSRLESGQRHPSYDTVARLVNVLEAQGEDRSRLYAAAGYLPPERVFSDTQRAA